MLRPWSLVHAGLPLWRGLACKGVQADSLPRPGVRRLDLELLMTRLRKEAEAIPLLPLRSADVPTEQSLTSPGFPVVMERGISPMLEAQLICAVMNE